MSLCISILQTKMTYGRWKIQSQSNSASNATLPSTIGSNDHVQIGTRAKLNIVVSNKVTQLYSNNGPRDVADKRVILS